MNIRQYARAKQKPLGPLRKLIRAVLHALGVPVTPWQTSETALRLWRPVLAARDQNQLTAVRYLTELDVPRLEIPAPRDYPMQALESAIDRVVGELRVVGEPVTEQNRGEIRVIEAAREAIEAPIVRQALEPAREIVAKLGEDETRPHYGWARVLVGPSSCSFCAVLASRGDVYSSRGAAVGRGGPMGAFHTPYLNKNGKKVGGFCDCEPVLVYAGVPWEGQAAAAALEKFWEDHAKGQPDSLNAFRRAWDGKIRKGDDMSVFLPESLQPKAGAA